MSQLEFEARWREMLAQSFAPEEWYDRDYPRPRVRAVWVFMKIEQGRYEVGFFGPGGQWHPEDGVYPTKDSAAERVNYLNGGAG